MLMFLLKLWNGNERLFIAFWYVLVPISIIQYLFAAPSTLIMQLFLLLIVIYSYVAVWRCAPNHNKGVVAWWLIARAFIFINIMNTVFGLWWSLLVNEAL